MIINTDESLYGDFGGWLVFIAVVAALIALGILVAKRIRQKDRQRLGRKDTAKPYYCYKTCLMISKFQNCLLEQEADNAALQEQVNWLRQRCRNKEVENAELRAELYKYKKQ